MNEKVPTNLSAALQKPALRQGCLTHISYIPAENVPPSLLPGCNCHALSHTGMNARAHFPTSGTSQESTEEFIRGAHIRSPLPTKQGSHPFKSCSKRAKAAPSMTMSTEEEETKKKPAPAPNWVVGATCIQFASAFVLMKMNILPWCCSSIAGRTEVSSLAMKPYTRRPINHTDDEIRGEKEATE